VKHVNEFIHYHHYYNFAEVSFITLLRHCTGENPTKPGIIFTCQDLSKDKISKYTKILDNHSRSRPLYLVIS